MNKVGRINVSGQLFRDDIEQVGEAFRMAGFMPVHVNHEVWLDRYAITGACDVFHIMQEGSIPPTYQMEIDTIQLHEVLKPIISNVRMTRCA